MQNHARPSHNVMWCDVGCSIRSHALEILFEDADPIHGGCFRHARSALFITFIRVLQNYRTLQNHIYREIEIPASLFPDKYDLSVFKSRVRETCQASTLHPRPLHDLALSVLP